MTYLAEQVSLGRKVAIKEFFMKDYCERDEETALVTLGTKSNKDLVERFRQKFVKEACLIASLNNQHIVKIHDIFEENGTAYYVMEYYGGGSLKDVVSRRGALPEHEAVKYVSEISDALKYIHNRNILHLDIKPSNVLLDDAGRCVLIDFGISKCYDDAGEQTSSSPVGKSKGYAPMEQYVAGGINKFTPATDIYSLGAVLYFLLTGHTPPDANEVYNDGLDPKLLNSVSSSVKSAVVAAMQPKRSDRLHSVDEFVNILSTAATNVTLSNSTQANIHRKRNLFYIFIAIVTFLGVGGIDLYFEKKEYDLSLMMEKDYFDQFSTVNICGIEYPMVFVPAGTFKMGNFDRIGDHDEKPTHRVRMRSYCIGKYEVTQEIWEAVMGTNPSYDKCPHKPVENVSWLDCQEFLKKVNELTGYRFTLPTEAQWEYAARGGGKSDKKFSGSNNIDEVCWYPGNSQTTQPVGLKLPNELGIYDMSGNVYEWCRDWYGIYDGGKQNDPNGPLDGNHKVYRGGSFVYGPRECRVTYRMHNTLETSYSHVGLRLCIE